jgi:hypothetical protein
LAHNGGPTATHALRAGSPALDAGEPSFAPPPDHDQRGDPFARVVGGRIDMGAYERQDLTVEIRAVPTPRIDPVNEVEITFNQPVTGFTTHRLALSVNAGPNLLADRPPLATTDSQTFVLGGLADLTAEPGYYRLALNSAGSGIVDRRGLPLDRFETVGWSMGPGDVNRDRQFNLLDIDHVVQGGKYLTAERAAWADGDFNGDAVFDQLDIVAALQTGAFVPRRNAAALVDAVLAEHP